MDPPSQDFAVVVSFTLICMFDWPEHSQTSLMRMSVTVIFSEPDVISILGRSAHGHGWQPRDPSAICTGLGFRLTKAEADDDFRIWLVCSPDGNLCVALQDHAVLEQREGSSFAHAEDERGQRRRRGRGKGSESSGDRKEIVFNAPEIIFLRTGSFRERRSRDRGRGGKLPMRSRESLVSLSPFDACPVRIPPDRSHAAEIPDEVIR